MQKGSDSVKGKYKIPRYSYNEEKANMITHIVGAVYGLVVLLICVGRAGWHHNIAGILSGIVYGMSMITVYCISSVYHGLNPKKSLRGKIIMRVIDHCDIYGLIAGSFAPVALTGIRRINPTVAWVSFSIVCVTSIIGIIFTAIDMTKFKAISYGAYFLAGWGVLFTLKWMRIAFPKAFIILLVAGGAVYTSGMIFFGLQKLGYKYCHSVFHIFILLGSIVMSVPIIQYCM